MASLSFQQFPALRVAALFALGVFAGRFFAGAVLPVAIVAALLLSFLMLACRIPRPGLFLLILPHLLCVSLGCLGFLVDSPAGASFPQSSVGQQIVIRGTVAGLPQRYGDRHKFLLESECIQTDSTEIPLRSNILVTLKGSTRIPEYGSVILAEGIIHAPSPPRNPGEFDQRRFYHANGIEWLLTVGKNDVLLTLRTGGGSWIMREIVAPARRAILSEIDVAIGGEEGEFLKGVLIGERGGLSSGTREAFTAAGVAHILAVSGGNVAVVVAFVLFAGEMLRCSRRARPVVACGGVIFYMLLVGNQPPVVRASIMALVILVGTLSEKRANPMNALGLSGLVILGLDSRQLFDVGFQLSFLAVFSIVHFYPILNDWIGRVVSGQGILSRSLVWVMRLAAVSMVATLGTLPLTAVYFGRVSIIGVIANILVVPASGLSLLLGFVAIPLSLLHPWLGGIFHGLNQLVLQLTLEAALWAGNLSLASLDTYEFRWIDALPLCSILLLLLYCNKKVVRTRLLLATLVALNIWVAFPRDSSTRARGLLRVSFIDVGQGDATLVEFPGGEVMLIDAGPSSPSFDSGRRVVVPFLKRRGISRTDHLVATHPHNDHIGGIPAVLGETEVVNVMDPGRVTESSVFARYLDQIADEGCRHSRVVAGNTAGVTPAARVYILAPEDSSEESENLNNSSVVLRLVYGSVSFLFTGDAERESEGTMVERYGDFLKSSVLKVGHHGSGTSSTDIFLDKVQPSIAVVSVGTPNRYRHPSDETVRRFAERGIATLRTDHEGAIILETDGIGIERVYWRNDDVW